MFASVFLQSSAASARMASIQGQLASKHRRDSGVSVPHYPGLKQGTTRF